LQRRDLLEILITLNVIFFIKRAAWTEYSVFAPILFALAVLVFAAEAGILSRLLRKGPFQLLGALSYSVYMMHYFIEEQIENAVIMAAKLKLFAYSATTQAEPPLWHGDLWELLMVCLLIPIAYFTYTRIEIPSRNWFRKYAATQATAKAQLARP
jgi:peptidoglycan/LPS O-acetylase OafA/YrhL